MRGPDPARPDPTIIETLRRSSTATVSTILRRKGVKNVWMPLKPLFPGMTTVGPALTIRTVPGREDIAPIAYQPGTLFPGHPDDAIEAVQPGDVVVVDGRGATHEGLFGDLLTLRIKMKGAAGLVCDMCVRDSPHMADKEIPIFCLGSVSPGGSVYNVDFNVPIGCAGVLVCPGDILIGDDDGVLVIPPSLLDHVVEEVIVFEDREEYIRLLLAAGQPLEGIYPMGPQREAEFRAWRAARAQEKR
jgi:regulator of RNase E activity RraA